MSEALSMHFSQLPPTGSAPTTGYAGQVPRGCAEALGAILATVDFRRKAMVNAAHEGLQASALTIFPPETFDGMDPEGVGRALASLMLCDFAAQRNQTTQWIEPDRDDVLRTLAVRLTPTGQEALLQSLENRQGDNAFSNYFAHADGQYFAQADAYCLAGHLYFQRAGSPLLAGSIDKTPEDASAQAARDYLKAADPTQHLMLVPLSRLRSGRSRRNVRTTPRLSIPKLAAGISRVSLLQKPYRVCRCRRQALRSRRGRSPPERVKAAGEEKAHPRRSQSAVPARRRCVGPYRKPCRERAARGHAPGRPVRRLRRIG
ncbi:hypothetical protein MB84_30565 (plasmid) [Pandoraea oxalativorans]|uniref:Uncharacterized protein n=1 Tax=Pandoraea oxalativorans TaxID=573737 RepID=A0A0G3ID06_9BURK|nr:hypothetical protein MB84_30565 [Pandoraea oxalativorans]